VLRFVVALNQVAIGRILEEAMAAKEDEAAIERRDCSVILGRPLIGPASFCVATPTRALATLSRDSAGTE
jgi:hypothetical protein